MTPNGAPIAVRKPIPHGLPLDGADRIIIWAIWSLVLAGVAREILGQTFVVSFGFYSLHVVDPAVVLTFVACVAYMVQRPLAWRGFTLPIVAIAGLILLNFVRGLPIDSNAALLWARGNIATGGLLLLSLYAPLKSTVLTAFRKALLVGGILLVGLVALRLFYGPQLFMTISGVDASEVNDSGRPLSAQGAYLLTLAATLLWSELFRRGIWNLPRRFALALILTAAEVLSGQGTASLALLAMIGITACFERGPIRQERVFAGLTISVLATFIWVTGLLESLQISKVGNWDLERRSWTFGGRQLIWAELMRVFSNYPFGTQLIGLPAGQRPKLLVMFRSGVLSDWSNSIHSMYYGSLPMMGFAGLAAYVALLAILIFCLLQNRLQGPPIKPVPAYALALCVGTAIISISYEVRNETILGLFAAIWWARAAQGFRGRPAATSSVATVRRRLQRGS